MIPTVVNDLERARSIRDVLADVTAALPDHLAVDDGTRTMTYAELSRFAYGVAHAVAARSEPGDRVSMMVADWPDAIAVCVGIMVAGRVVVPLDPRDPAERLAAINRDAEGVLAITDHGAHPGADDTAQIALDTVEPDDAPPAVVIDPYGPGKLYFTSGTTGTAKGVLRDHQCTTSGPFRSHELHRVTPDDRIGLSGSIGFIGPYARIFLAMVSGGTACPYDVSGIGPVDLARWIRDQRLTIVTFVPSVLRAVVDAAGPVMDSARVVEVGGEPVYWRDVVRARPFFRDETVFCNRLASTEFGAITSYKIGPGDEHSDGPLPIGRPQEHMQVRVVDDDGAEVADGDVGLVEAIGDQIALEYWRDPELTATRFFVTPDGRRGFRGNDLLRWRADGLLEHFGRADDRVKVRGAMASPAEVERTLVALDGVREAAVIADPTSEGGTRLVAYVVPDPDNVPGAWQLRRELATRLPSHMVPGPILMLEALPLGARGKIDRGALPPLPAPTPSRAAVGRERAVAELFCDVLGLDEVGVDDDFFDLGGDSLAAIELVSAITERFGVDIETSVLLDAPSVAVLAPLLVSTRQRGASCAIRLRDGTATPFFCVAGGGSPAVSLRALADGIGNRPCYGIQARGLEERTRPDRSVAACARHYLADVRAIQPDGPYLLGGHSFGGLVAFEMACRLEEAGGAVALLVLIDTFLHEPVPDETVANETALAHNFRARLSSVRSHARARWLDITAGVVPRGVRQYHVFSQLSNRAARAYRPTVRYTGNALMAVRGSADPAWEPLLTGPVTVVDVPGDHVTMLRRPYVDPLGAQLGRALDDHSAEGSR